MKRSEALTPLSREHHQALVTAVRLKKAGAVSEAELNTCWQWVMQQKQSFLDHFREEENYFGDLLKGSIREQFYSDHRYLTEQLADEHLMGSEILTFAERLQRHVRFEEREMFPWLEEHCSSVLAERSAR